MRNAFVYFVSIFCKHAQYTMVSYNTIPKAELVPLSGFTLGHFTPGTESPIHFDGQTKELVCKRHCRENPYQSDTEIHTCSLQL